MVLVSSSVLHYTNDSIARVASIKLTLKKGKSKKKIYLCLAYALDSNHEKYFPYEELL